MNKKVNEFVIKDNVCLVKATNSDVWFKIDVCDIEKCKCHSWRSYTKRKDGDYYFQADVWDKKTKTRTRINLHRFLMNCVNGDGNVIDHKNGDTLDNTRNNLRLATINENCRNSKTQKNNNTGRSGVGFHKVSGKYRARIVVNNKEIYLGLFDTFEQACIAREKAEQKYFKEFSSYEFK